MNDEKVNPKFRIYTFTNLTSDDIELTVTTAGVRSSDGTFGYEFDPVENPYSGYVYKYPNGFQISTPSVPTTAILAPGECVIVDLGDIDASLESSEHMRAVLSGGVTMDAVAAFRRSGLSRTPGSLRGGIMVSQSVQVAEVERSGAVR